VLFFAAVFRSSDLHLLLTAAILARRFAVWRSILAAKSLDVYPCSNDGL
jgi:hypothetical protein